VDGSAWRDDDGQVVGAAVVAAPDRAAYQAQADAPGVFFGASRSLASSETPASLLDRVRASDVFPTASCRFVERADYADPLYRGTFDRFEDCAGTPAGLVLVAAEPEDRAYLMLLAIQLATAGDAATLDHILETFQVEGGLP
jgi:hypothetical protein